MANSADIEFAEKGLVLVKARNPLMSRDDKIKVLRGFVDSLTQETFMVYRNKILDMINIKKERAEKFKTANEQTDSIIFEVPRLSILREDILARVKKERKRYKLEV